MKKLVALMLTVAMLLSFATITPVMANTNITVKIDGNPVVFDVQPQLINNRTMVPLRAIFEALGATVDWNNDTQTVTSTRGNTTISLTIDSTTMYVNGAAVALDTPACLVSGRTLVPVRAISEAFGIAVEWDDATKTVIISNPIVYTGHGDQVISNVNIPAGSYYAELTHDGDRNFISKLHYGEKSYDYFSLSNEIGECALQVALYNNGNVAVNDGMLEVRADGNWTIAFKPVSGTTTTNVRGKGQVVTGTFTATQAKCAFNLSHDGDRNFIAKVIKYNGTKSYDYESLSNEIGAYSGTKMATLEVGQKYYFYVRADGNWSIDMGLGDSVTTYNASSISPAKTTTVTSNQKTEDTDGDKMLNVSMDKNSSVAKNVKNLKDAIIDNGQRLSNGYGFMHSFGDTTIALMYLREQNVCAFLLTSKTSGGTEVITTLYLHEDQIPAVSISFDGEFIFMANYSQPSEEINIIQSSGVDETCIEVIETAYEGFDMLLEMIALSYPDFEGIEMADFGLGL